MSSVSAVNVQEHEQSYSNKSYDAARTFFYAKPLMLAQTDTEAPSDLPLNFHPAAIRASAVFITPLGAVG
ncbi:hypothetical protein GOD61_30250, partial [Sinorhizobium medicae]|nr:hypothetical protein [Sinorhizobium medicae]